MLALYLEAVGKVNVKDVPAPVAAANEKRLKITHCAVCRTDAEMWRNGHRDLVLPRIPGHELCGVSEDGHRYVVWPGVSCGICPQCLKGVTNLCREMQVMGFHRDGGFAEYAVTPASSLIPVRNDLPGEIACMAEPLACTINAIEQARLQPMQKVLIFGAGTVGLLLGLAVKASGGRPYIIDIDPDKLSRSETYRKKIGIHTDIRNLRFDIAINAAPSSDTFTRGLSLLDDGGCFCLFSGLTDSRPIPAKEINEIHYRQFTIVGAYGCTQRQMEKSLEILHDYREEVRLLIEKTIDLHEVQDVFPGILAGKCFKYHVQF